MSSPHGAASISTGVIPQSITASPSNNLSSPHHAPTNQCSDDDSQNFVCQFNSAGSKWECVKKDYKSTVLQQVMDQHENREGSRATIDQLKEFGITVYLAEHDSVDMFLLKQVVMHVAASKSDRSKSRYENQRCLLYRDENGRLFNLTLDNGAHGLASTWRSVAVSYSGLQAMVALTILARAYACADVLGAILKPGYLALILGLILHEEMSHVMLNVALFVRGMPSVAAYTLLSHSESDWPRKFVVLLLAVTSAMEEGSAIQRYCTLVGIGLAMVLLAANLGSRAWYFMKWKPLRTFGGTSRVSFLAPIFSLFVATLTGFIFPYIGFQRIQAGGRAAIQLVVLNTVVVALLFVASDLDVIQQYLVVGSHHCNQDGVNVTLGIWFAMTSITCIFAARKIEHAEVHPEDNDPILVEEQTSPVGYSVPNFPNFPIDPMQFGRRGLGGGCTSRMSARWEIVLGVIVSVGMGVFVVSTSFYGYMGDANDYITQGETSGYTATSELV